MELERYQRNLGIIDQSELAEMQALVIGCGAVGSHLAKILAELGLSEIVLCDFDYVETANLSVQGFAEDDLGLLKTEAIANHCKAINSEISVSCVSERFTAKNLPLNREKRIVAFLCLDSIDTRKTFFSMYKARIDLLIDTRLASQAFEVYAIDCNDPKACKAYESSIFPRSESWQAPRCTERAIIDNATASAAFACQAFRRLFSDSVFNPWKITVDLFGLDIFVEDLD